MVTCKMVAPVTGTTLRTRFSLSMEMIRLTRDGTAEPVSRDQTLRHARGQGNVHFPCSADHEQDWQPYPVDPYSAICDDHTYIHTYYWPCAGRLSAVNVIGTQLRDPIKSALTQWLK